MKLEEIHRQDSEKIASNLAFLKEKDEKKPFKLAQDRNYSNTIRKNNYKEIGPTIDISKLNRIISVDCERKVALVEPRVTMEQLVTETLKYGLVPLVVPEFKGITVGGAIMGSAIESSSFRHGQFNDICLSYEVLLGNGEIIDVSSTNHPDLYYGLTGSYGSLGIILSVEIQLISVGSSIEISYFPFNHLKPAIAFISEQCRNSEFDFIEAIAYSESFILVIAGKNSRETNQRAFKSTFSLSKIWSPLFYEHAKKMAIDGHSKEYIPVFDYLFRHDRGAFWMASYAKHPWMFARFFLDKFGIAPSWLKKLELDQSKYSELQYPGTIFRTLFGWMLDSERLYRILHSGGEQWFHDHFVIQDFFIPERNSLHFAEHVLEEYGINPLWICPVLSTSKPQFLSPHWVDKTLSNEYLMDIGVYGFPRKGAAPEITKKLEKLTQAYDGRKMLYGYSYYSLEEFWKIYSKDMYQKLRDQYHATGVWMDLPDKVLGE